MFGGKLLDEYYDRHDKELDPIKQIVFDIYSDISSRKGLNNILDEIGNDIKEDMLQSWINMTEETLSV